MKHLSDRIKNLSPEQRALFEAQLKAKNLKADKILPKGGTIPRRGHNNPSPLSFDQERLWFFHQMNPDKPTYNVYGAIRLEGKLDVVAMTYAVNEIVRRHESWRTTFELVDGHPMQIVQEELNLRFDESDLRDWPEDSREEEAHRRTLEEVMIPIDIVNGPLVRVKLIRLSEKMNIIVLTVHHLVTDRVTFSIVFQELVMHYNAYLQGQPSPVPMPEIQYSDYTEWQRRHLSGAERERLMKYWVDLLGDSEFVLNMPTDHPRPPVQTYKGARHFLEVPKAIGDRLKEFGTREGATPFMVLMAAYKLLLYRWSGQQDIIVGTPLANRDKPEMERALGYFLTSGVFRTQVEGRLSFRELLARVRQHSLDAFEHAGMPFGLLLDELNPKRDPSRNPVFQAMFVYVDVPEKPMEFPDLKISYELIDGETAKYDLTLCLIDRDGIVDREFGTECFLEYSPDLYEAETIERMGRHFLNLVQAVVEHPDMPIDQLPMLTDEERHLLLNEWNGCEGEESGLCLHEMIEKQVEETPDHAAVEFESATLTYRELNERANQLAHYLRGLGAWPEKIVGVCTDRSLEMIVALLAVLKTGAAYLPLDPAYPRERMEFLLQDAGVEVVLTQEHLKNELGGLAQHLIVLGGANQPYANESTANVESGVQPDHLAYVIYTSGSTGQPKGVLIEHRGAVNTVEALSEQYDLHAESRVLQVASYTFDASVLEIFMTLTSGATLVMARREQLLPGPEYKALLRDKQITAAVFTPAVLAQLDSSELPALRTVGSAGDACTADIVKRWSANSRFLNVYGPTECSIIAYTAVCTADDMAPSIGRPFKNVYGYVLDSNRQPTPVGVPGELYIGGVGVARGYLNRPELTQERFLPDPFREQEGARMYRTGDLVRYRRDGQLEFLGRLDHQVKVRGYRIELGEVESRIAEHERVQDTVALALDDATGVKRLVAYVVPHNGCELTVADLRGFLKERLPDYMVPSVIVFLDRMPLTSHGKIDRANLPHPDGAMDDLEASYVAPRNAVEEVLASIWSELLGVTRVGVMTHFFDLGGHSLLATQMISRVRDTFQINVPMDKLFEVGTISDMSRVLAEHEQRPGMVDKIARIHKRLAEMSDAEASEMLNEKKNVRGESHHESV